MDKFIKLLQKYLVPFGDWMSKRKTLNAITGGMRVAFPMIMIGCVINIIANPPVTEELLKGSGFIAAFLGGWNNFATTYKDILMVPYNLTMGIMGFIVLISASYNLAKSYKLDPLMSSMIAMVTYLMVSAPTQNAVLLTQATQAIASGSADSLRAASMMSTQYMGSMGMFTAIFVAVVSVQITRFCRDKKIEIPMPDSIPPFVKLSFSSILPLLFNIVIIYGLNIALGATIHITLPEVILAVINPVVDAVSNPVVMFALGTLGSMFWAIGMHGGIVNGPIIPVYLAACLSNAELVAAGQAPVFHPVLMMTYGYAGGMGCVLALALVMSRSKSKQLRAMGKMGIIPGIFGISEPLMFGTPIILNPILALPMILSCMAVWILGYVGFVSGILVPPSIPILSVMPIGLANFLHSNSISNLLFPFVGTILAMVIYYPFVKVFEKQKLEEEATLEEQNKEKVKTVEQA